MAAGLLLYLLVIVVLAFAAFQFTAWYRRKRLEPPSQEGPPTGFEPSEEIFIDPTTGVRQRVWYNNKTGERYYETLK